MSGPNNYGGITGGGNDDSGMNDSSGSGISDHPRKGKIFVNHVQLSLYLFEDVGNYISEPHPNQLGGRSSRKGLCKLHLYTY